MAALSIPLYPDGPPFGYVVAALLACCLLCCARAARRRLGAAKRARLGGDARYAPPKEARAVSPDDVEDEGLLRARLERYESNREQASLLTSAAARGAALAPIYHG